jgi:hypothetical protein
VAQDTHRTNNTRREIKMDKIISTEIKTDNNETTSELKAFMNKVKETNISYENASEYYNNYVSHIKGLLSNINNDNREYVRLINSLNEQANDTNTPIYPSKEYVRRRAYDTLLEAHQRLREMHGFRTIQAEVGTMMNNKLVGALARSKSLEIEKLALEQFREMQKEYFKFQKEQMEEKMQSLKRSVELSYEKQLNYAIDALRKDHQANREMIQTLIDFLTNTQKDTIIGAYKIEEENENTHKSITENPPIFFEPSIKMHNKKKAQEEKEAELEEAPEEIIVPDEFEFENDEKGGF